MTTYSDNFYATIRAGTESSAKALVPILLDQFDHVRTVLDVGCGEGWWAIEFEAMGCDVRGIDGDWHGVHRLGSGFTPHNLADPLPDWKVDAIVCLEVAEHLPPARAQSFIADLCRIAPLVFFSAAIPNQGGTHHVNEQWPAYWADLFNANGFAVDGEFRYQIWNDDRIENWYRQNLLIAWAEPHLDDFKPPLPLVHPVLWKAYRG